jgi:hypothetical protein
MWDWIRPLVEAILNFFRQLTKETTVAQDADPEAGGMRRRFRDFVRSRVRQPSDPGA